MKATDSGSGMGAKRSDTPTGMWRRSFLAAALTFAAVPGNSAPNAFEAARIERLIQFVEAQSQVKFVRNGVAYSCRDAAKFLRGKFDKMGEHVSTAAQFIDDIASRSSVSGQAYLIRYADGRTVPTAQFLREELARMDRQP